MGPEFHQSRMGVRFFDAQLPQLIKAIQENTEELKRANDLKEKELEQTEKLFGIEGAKRNEKAPEGHDMPHDSRG